MKIPPARFALIRLAKAFIDSISKLYNVGPNPHADEIVVVYLPKEKILLVGDLMMTRITGPFPPVRATDLDLAKKLRRLDLKVDTIANGHGWIGTVAEFLKSLERP